MILKYEPCIRALLGTASHFCEVDVLPRYLPPGTLPYNVPECSRVLEKFPGNMKAHTLSACASRERARVFESACEFSRKAPLSMHTLPLRDGGRERERERACMVRRL